MTTQRQAKRRLEQIAKIDSWTNDAALVEEYSKLQKIANLHVSKMTEEQIRIEMADGNAALTHERAWAPRFCCDRSQIRFDSVGNYLIFRLRGGQEMNTISDAIGQFPSFGVENPESP